jgi:hypothetical protein
MNTNKRSYYIGDCENLIIRLKTVYTLTFTIYKKFLHADF